jgi:hypothetical protein
MKATISSSKDTPSKRFSIIYIESPLNNVADKFAMEHNIYHAPFKSKTWSKVCQLTSKQHVKALKELFPESSTIRFSAKAGCRCGCSPGYVMKYDHPNQFGRVFWVDIEPTETEVTELKNKLGKLAGEFAAEYAAYKNKLKPAAAI